MLVVSGRASQGVAQRGWWPGWLLRSGRLGAQNPLRATSWSSRRTGCPYQSHCQPLLMGKSQTIRLCQGVSCISTADCHATEGTSTPPPPLPPRLRHLCLPQTALDEIIAADNMTVLTVAHRLSSIKGCDTIIIMDQVHLQRRGQAIPQAPPRPHTYGPSPMPTPQALGFAGRGGRSAGRAVAKRLLPTVKSVGGGHWRLERPVGVVLGLRTCLQAEL